MKFIDAQNREILVREDDGIVTAHHQGKKIASLETWEGIQDERGEGPQQLKFADTDEEYQRAGIGIEMLRIASDLYGMLQPPPRNPAMTDNRMTTCGMGLVMKGQSKGYVLPFPDDDSLEDDY